MRINLIRIAPLLAAGAAAIAIAAAPTAAAADAGTPAADAAALPPGCYLMGPDPVCPDTHSTSTAINPSPENSSINASPGPVDLGPQYPYYYGGNNSRGNAGGFGGGFGGGHGEGGHGGGGHGGGGR